MVCIYMCPLNIKGVVYRRCARTAMTYGSETWPMKKSDEDVLVRTCKKHDQNDVWRYAKRQIENSRFTEEVRHPG